MTLGAGGWAYPTTGHITPWGPNHMSVFTGRDHTEFPTRDIAHHEASVPLRLPHHHMGG